MQESKADAANDWGKVDLERGTLLVCHDNAQHPQLVEILRDVRQLVWFPGMVKYVRDHWDSCVHCLHIRKGKEVVGTGIGAFRRGAVMQLDHKVLKDREAVLATPYKLIAVLTMVDVATRIVQYVPAVTQRAEESAHAVITRWVPIIGLPEHVTSDSHSGSASNTITTLLKMLGVQKHKLQPREAKGVVAIV